MTERTFRAVVASVLVGALALAVVVAVAVLPRSMEPVPSASTITSPAANSLQTATPEPVVGPVFEVPDVVSVGLISRGANSANTLVLQFLESRANAIPHAAGSFRVTLADHAGDGSTVAFGGEPTVIAPGSLGATAAIVAPNVLMVAIVDSDSLNIELITIKGLGISISSTAATGPLNATLTDFEGSLATGAATKNLPSPGTVIAGP